MLRPSGHCGEHCLRDRSLKHVYNCNYNRIGPCGPGRPRWVPKRALTEYVTNFCCLRSYLSVECVKHHPGESSSALGDMWLSVGILTLEGIFYLCVFVAVITRSL